MQVVTNEKLIRRRARIGNILSLGSLVVLLVGMIISLTANPETPAYGLQVMISFLCLGSGFVAANIGAYFMRRWGRRPRPDQVLVESLKGFDERNIFFAWQLPAPMVLLGPRGVYAFVTRDQSGDVYVEGERYRQPWRWTRLLNIMGQEGLGNPAAEARETAERLRKFIAERVPALANTPIYPIVVFIHPKVTLHMANPSVPTMVSKKLKDYLRGPGQGEPLSAEQRRALADLFGAPAKPKKGQPQELVKA